MKNSISIKTVLTIGVAFLVSYFISNKFAGGDNVVLIAIGLLITIVATLRIIILKRQFSMRSGGSRLPSKGARFRKLILIYTGIALASSLIIWSIWFFKEEEVLLHEALISGLLMSALLMPAFIYKLFVAPLTQ